MSSSSLSLSSSLSSSSSVRSKMQENADVLQQSTLTSQRYNSLTGYGRYLNVIKIGLYILDYSTVKERFECIMAIHNQDVFLGFQYKVEATK